MDKTSKLIIGFMSILILGLLVLSIHYMAKAEVAPKEDRFVVIETQTQVVGGYEIMYDRETGVEYVVMTRTDKMAMSPLYDKDGNVMIYNEETKDEN